MNRTELLERIKQRQSELDQIKIDLKKTFFGIDDQIDKLLEYIKAWYITPEIINRPLIINLWGLTGVGKTSLIRELVNKLKFTNKFVEIQMGDDNTTSSYHNGNLCSILKQSAIEESEAGIILLDEFQRFRTVDSHGQDVKDQKFQDIWMLLSDGKFAKDYSLFEKIMDFSEYNLTDYSSMESDYDNSDEVEESELHLIEPPAKKKKKKKVIPFKNRKLTQWQIRSLKGLLGKYVSMDELKSKTILDAELIIKDFLNSDKNGVIDYSRCLVFVSGNLDEAYKMSDDVEDCDTDAEIFYQKTKNLSINEIKKALNVRFKPEQIARLGNNHIIYPSLSKNAYEKIIESACTKYIIDAELISGIKFDIKRSVIAEIYNNSVYPAQGTRPVFSSIHKMFTSPLTNAMFWGLVNNINHIDVEISSEESAIIFSNNKEKLNVNIDFDMRDSKNKYTDNFSAMVSVHECGHALAYALLFGKAPAQVKINLASFNGGFNQFLGSKTPTKDSIKKTIAVLLAGSMAEQIIFGEDLRSSGSENDLINATRNAAMLVRRLGMEDYNSYVMVSEENNFQESIKETDPSIEKIISTEKENAIQLLSEHKHILVKMSKILFDTKEILGEDFIKLFGKELGVHSVEGIEQVDIAGDFYNILMSQE